MNTPARDRKRDKNDRRKGGTNREIVCLSVA